MIINKKIYFLTILHWFTYQINKVLNLSILSFNLIENNLVNKKSKAVINQQAEQILNNYGNAILRLAYSYLHNMSDAEDVLQDTLIQFLKKPPTFENYQHEKAWVLRVASNISKNKIKYNSLRKVDELNEELIADNHQNLSFVWDAVKKLPIKYQEVIHLFYYEGYSSNQIAQILNKNETTIRSHLHRGRNLLKDILKEDCDFEERIY